MGYTEEDLKRLGITDTVPEIIELDVFKSFDNVLNLIYNTNNNSIKDDDIVYSTKNFLRDRLEEYKDLLETFQEFNTDERKELYEAINSWRNAPDAYNYLLHEITRQNGQLKPDVFVNGYNKLASYIDNSNGVPTLRNDNRHVVSGVENDIKVIHFLPISHNDIPKAIDNIVDYYNSPEKSDIDLFIKPIVIHGLTAILQMFQDGNARYGRIMQYLSFFTTSNKLFNNTLEYPIIGCSREYMNSRNMYRDLIIILAIAAATVTNNNTANNNDFIDLTYKWLKYNAERLANPISLLNENLANNYPFPFKLTLTSSSMDKALGDPMSKVR